MMKMKILSAAEDQAQGNIAQPTSRKPSRPSSPTDNLILKRIAELRDSLSHIRDDVTRNENSISRLKTTADHLTVQTIDNDDQAQRNKKRITNIKKAVKKLANSMGTSCHTIDEEPDGVDVEHFADQIDKLEKAVCKIEAELKDVKASASNNADTAAELKKLLGDQGIAVNLLQETAATYNDRITTSEEKVSGLEERLDDVFKTLGIQKDKLISLDEKLTSTTELATSADLLARSNLTTLSGLSSELQDAQGEIDTVNTKLSGLTDLVGTVEGKVETHSTELLNVLAKLAEIQDQLTSIPGADQLALINSVKATAEEALGMAESNEGSISDNLSTLNELSLRCDDIQSTVAANIRPDLNKLFNEKKAYCSSVVMEFSSYGATPGGTFSGSGSYITLTNSDLQFGLFLTCAHNIIRDADGTVQRASAVYIEGPSATASEWIRVNPSLIYVDGVGDIALIRTNIDLRAPEYKPLKLASSPAKTGDKCIVIGDPGAIDSDSMALGIVRSARYEMKPYAYQVTECLHIDASTIGGNSGSPIMNESGEIIGMLTYGQAEQATYGGGPNVNSLRKSLSVLSQFRNNIEKKYLGMVWGVAWPGRLFSLKGLNPNFVPSTSGIEVYQVSPLSPFSGRLAVGDIIYEVTPYDAAGNAITTYKIGVHDDETPLGVLIYDYNAKTVKVTYLYGGTATMKTITVPLSKTYANVPEIYDMPLTTGLRTPVPTSPSL